MSDIEQHFVQTITQKQSYEEAKNPKHLFLLHRRHILCSSSAVSRKNSGKIYFPIERVMGFFTRSLIHAVPFKRFSPYTICLYVCKTGKQITWEQRTHWDRQLWLNVCA